MALENRGDVIQSGIVLFRGDVSVTMSRWPSPNVEPTVHHYAFMRDGRVFTRTPKEVQWRYAGMWEWKHSSDQVLVMGDGQGWIPITDLSWNEAYKAAIAAEVVGEEPNEAESRT